MAWPLFCPPFPFYQFVFLDLKRVWAGCEQHWRPEGAYAVNTEQRRLASTKQAYVRGRAQFDQIMYPAWQVVTYSELLHGTNLPRILSWIHRKMYQSPSDEVISSSLPCVK